MNYYRRQSTTLAAAWNDGAGPPIEEAPSLNEQGPEQEVQTRLRMERLVSLLRVLPEVQREAFLLREEAGMSVDEIAEATGVERETAKSRVRYAINRLRRGLLEYL